MAGGQQIDSGQGTLLYNELVEEALAGEESAGATGTAALTLLVPLRSKKFGTGTAILVLTGAELAGTQGTLTYGGLATINWNANTEPDLAGYYVYHGTSPLGYTERVTLGLVTTYQWGGLTGGLTHYFAVSAFDTTGNESGKSVEVSKAY